MSEITTSTSSSADSSSDGISFFNHTKGLIKAKFPGASESLLSSSSQEVVNFLKNHEGITPEGLVESLPHIEFFNEWDIAAIMADVKAKKQSNEEEGAPSMGEGPSQDNTAPEQQSSENIESAIDAIDNAQSQDFNKKVSTENALAAEESRNVQSALASENSRVQSAMASNIYRAPAQQKIR